MFETISPIDGSVYYKGKRHSTKDIDTALVKANKAQKGWAELTIKERGQYVKALVEAIVLKEQQLEKQADGVRQNLEMLQSEVTKMNEHKQGFHAEVRRLNARIKELECGDHN